MRWNPRSSLMGRVTGLTSSRMYSCTRHLVAHRLTNKEIAASLNLSEFTVKNHIRRVMMQMEAESRHEAVDLIRATGHLVAQ
jgi:DNA-binding CsgD family transcriptional regulator